MTCRVSVIIACYNQAEYVAEALASLQSQTVGDWEAIVVDDGSTDDSAKVIAQFLGDTRIRLLKVAHAGAAHARNVGMIAAKGELIAFLDADDRWQPHKLAKQLEVFRTKPTVGVCYTRRNLINADGNRCGGDDTRGFHRGIVLDAMFRDNFVCFSSAMVRRSVIDQCGLFDESLSVGSDYEWWLRLSRVCIFDYIDEPLVDYRTGHGSLSKRVEERLHTALTVMSRLSQDYDKPRRLSRKSQRHAFAETYRSLGLVTRSRAWSSIGWLLRSLALRPLSLPTWRALCGNLMPASLRRMRRAWAGQADWEKTADGVGSH